MRRGVGAVRILCTCELRDLFAVLNQQFLWYPDTLRVDDEYRITCSFLRGRASDVDLQTGLHQCRQGTKPLFLRGSTCAPRLTLIERSEDGDSDRGECEAGARHEAGAGAVGSPGFNVPAVAILGEIGEDAPSSRIVRQERLVETSIELSPVKVAADALAPAKRQGGVNEEG